MNLSEYLRYNPTCIHDSLHHLTCSSQNVITIDIDPTVLQTIVLEHRNYRNHEARKPRVPPELAVMVERQLDSAAANKNTECQGLNLITALSITTLYLSYNKIDSILGIVQFRNVMRLSLIGNHIRKIEDCEPLSQLLHLRYLSLDHNPVCRVLHYRSHLLRITSWPEPLSVQNCRLHKLDGVLVRPEEIQQGIKIIAGEIAFLPGVFERVERLRFVRDLERRMAIRSELEACGVLTAVGSKRKKETVLQLVTLCCPSFFQSRDVLSGAHQCRLFIGKYLKWVSNKKNRTSPTDQSFEEVLLSEISGESDCLDLLDEVSDILGDHGRRNTSPLMKSTVTITDVEASSSLYDMGGEKGRLLLAQLDIGACLSLLKICKSRGETLNSEKVDLIFEHFTSASREYCPVSSLDIAVQGGRGDTEWCPNTQEEDMPGGDNTPLLEKPPLAPKVDTTPPRVDSTEREIIVEVDLFSEEENTSLSQVSPMSSSRPSPRGVGPEERGVLDCDDDVTPSEIGSIEEADTSINENAGKEQQAVLHYHRHLGNRVLSVWKKRLTQMADWTMANWWSQTKLFRRQDGESFGRRPQWSVTLSGALDRLPRNERKRYFFDSWVQRTEEVRHLREFQLSRYFKCWRKRTEEQWATRQLYTSSVSSSLSDTFTIWKEKTKSALFKRKYIQNEQEDKPQRERQSKAATSVSRPERVSDHRHSPETMLDYHLRGAESVPCKVWSPISPAKEGSTNRSQSPLSLLNVLHGMTGKAESRAREDRSAGPPRPMNSSPSVTDHSARRTGKTTGAIIFSPSGSTKLNRSDTNTTAGTPGEASNQKVHSSVSTQCTPIQINKPSVNPNAYPDITVEQLVERAKQLEWEKLQLVESYLGAVIVEDKEYNKSGNCINPPNTSNGKSTEETGEENSVSLQDRTEEEIFQDERTQLLEEISKLKCSP